MLARVSIYDEGTAGGGLGVRADADIRAGEELMRELPYAASVVRESASEICSHCFKRTHGLPFRACGACGVAHYCSGGCQRADCE